MPEQAPLGRSHLEEAEVLAVLGVGSEAGLASGDGKRLTAVPPEDPADHVTRRCFLDRGETPGLGAAREGAARRSCLPLHPGVARLVKPQLPVGLDREPRVAQQPGVRFEESEHLLVLLQGAQVTRELGPEVGAGL